MSLLSTGAEAIVHGTYVHHCQQTPPDNTPSYPGAEKMVRSSNLAQPAGKSMPAPGQLVYLSGRVYDVNCVPLQGAKIELWQADAEGKFTSPGTGAFLNPYPLFAGSGRALSDNKGEFGFVSIFPGSYSITYNGRKRTRAPNVSLRITHPSFRRPYLVEMYFWGDMRNAEDPYFQRYRAEQRGLLEATVQPVDAQDINKGLRVFYDITLPEADPFRRY